MKERHKLTPAAYLLLEKDNKILLIRRYNTGYEDGNYSLIAGHVDEGESYEDTMVREAKEEAGIIIKKEDLVFVHANHRPKSNYLDIYFRPKKWSGKPENKEPSKCDEFLWINWDSLPKNLIPHVRNSLLKIKNSEFYSEFD
jgi:8-oxo-dGTP diphosphatase